LWCIARENGIKTGRRGRLDDSAERRAPACSRAWWRNAVPDPAGNAGPLPAIDVTPLAAKNDIDMTPW